MAKSRRPNSHDRKHLHDTWKVCEGVAMHFNTLLQGFRLKAIGGIALGAAIVVGLKLCDSTNHLAIALFFAALAAIWALVWALDFFYYYRLLAGAVDELLRIERELGDVYLSHQIEHRVAHSYAAAGATATNDLSHLHLRVPPPPYPPWSIRVFYLVPLCLLLLASVCVGFHFCCMQCEPDGKVTTCQRTCCRSTSEITARDSEVTDPDSPGFE
jgi:hypothetical protein